jgi:hypothetical protein
MAAGYYATTMEQGTDWFRIIQVLKEDDTPRGLTGFTGRGEMRVSAKSPTVIATFNVTIVEPLEGKIKIELPESVTKGIPTTGGKWNEYTEYVFDVEIISSLGKVERILNGIIRVSPEVTKNA